MGREVGGGSGLGTRVHLWWIHVDAWQNECNIVISLQLKLKKKKKRKKAEKKKKESISKNKASGGDGIPVGLFQILKGDAVKVMHSICQQIWKTQQWPQDWKR